MVIRRLLHFFFPRGSRYLSLQFVLHSMRGFENGRSAFVTVPFAETGFSLEKDCFPIAALVLWAISLAYSWNMLSVVIIVIN